MKKTTKIICICIAIIAIVSILMVSFAACNKDIKVSYIVGVQSKTTGEDFVSNYRNCSKKGYSNGEEAVEALLSDKIDFVVLDLAAANALAEEVDFKDKIKVINYGLTVESYGIAISKDQPELKTQINSILAQMMEGDNSILNTIIEKHLTEGATVDKYATGLPDENKKDDQLVVLTNAAFKPFEDCEKVQGVKYYYGIDIDIADYIAKQLNKDLVIVDLEFEDILDKLAENSSYDIAISAMSIVEYRKEFADFSDPYFFDTEATQVVIVKADDSRFDDCKSADDVKKIIAG